jgi:choline dehydrogenase-like flavoprotein
MRLETAVSSRRQTDNNKCDERLPESSRARVTTEELHMYVADIPPDAEFDFIVVGSGSAGCAVVNRLSADGRHRVLLLEAGGRDGNYNIHIPLMVANVLNDTRWTWPYMTEPQMHLNGKTQKWARGRVIGGSSSVNGNLFVRGDPH